MINKDKPQPNPLDYTEAPLDIDEYRTTIANTRNISDTVATRKLEAIEKRIKRYKEQKDINNEELTRIQNNLTFYVEDTLGKPETAEEY